MIDSVNTLHRYIEISPASTPLSGEIYLTDETWFKPENVDYRTRASRAIGDRMYMIDKAGSSG